MIEKELPKFNEKAKCKKCGCDHVESEYIRYDTEIETNSGVTTITSMGSRGSKEAIIRRCGRCGFSWLEAVK